VGTAETLPLLETRQQVQLFDLFRKISLPEDILLVCSFVLEIGQILLLQSPLNLEHLRELSLVRKRGLVALAHRYASIK
jgi:hypothetical protein